MRNLHYQNFPVRLDARKSFWLQIIAYIDGPNSPDFTTPGRFGKRSRWWKIVQKKGFQQWMRSRSTIPGRQMEIERDPDPGALNSLKMSGSGIHSKIDNELADSRARAGQFVRIRAFRG
jgi:hypothetical protein